jgi:hypothetical protein
VDADAAGVPQRFYRAAEFRSVPGVDSSLVPGEGGFQFTLRGEASRMYQIQASTNLISWAPLTNVLMTNAVLLFRDGDAAQFPQRFYRIVAP